jgi:phosphate starvation-inducible protein PhoH
MSNKNRKQRAKIDPNFRIAEIEPLTKNQVRVFESDKHQVLHGSAGSGKTFICSYLAYKAVLRGEFSGLVYIRSAVPTRNIGFLPGTEAEKVEVYEIPYKEIATELFDRGDAYESLKRAEAVKFTTTSHIRGITLRNKVIIVDECQNMSYQELDSIITRVGEDCRIYFCGDFYQRDLKDTGIREFYDVLKRMGEFDFTNFTIDDVVRSDLVKSYLRAKYDKSNSEQSNLSTSRPRVADFIAERADVSDTELQQSNPTYYNPELWHGEAVSNVYTNRSDGSDTCSLPD